MRPDKRDKLSFEEASAVLRHLVTIAASRAQARSYFDQMRELLRDFSAGNCPMSHDVTPTELEPKLSRRPTATQLPVTRARADGGQDLHWLTAESWNRGVTAFKERKLYEAEEWMAGAFAFVKLSSTYAWLKDKMTEQYKICLKQIGSGDGQNERHFRTNLTTRICAGAPTDGDVAMPGFATLETSCKQPTLFI